MGNLTRGGQNIAWIERYCRVPEGKHAGEPLRLRPFQKREIYSIYNRRTRRAIISRARKNGKTALAAALLLLHLCGPEAARNPNSQLYSTALAREQAAIVFALACKMIRMSPELLAVVGIRETAKQLYCEPLGTLYRALSSEASTAFGFSPVFALHDELGQVRGPRSQLYEAVETGMGAHEEPLSIIISTQAPTDGDLLSILIDDAKTGKDPKTQLFLYTADESLDPFSLTAIRAANPAFGDFLNADTVLEQAEDARRMPSREAAYRNLVLNQRVETHAPFISRPVWDRNQAAAEIPPGTRVKAALDLSARNDLTACAVRAELEDGDHFDVKFWAPELNLEDRSRRDRAPYDVWAREGWIELTPGASVDYELVAKFLIELADRFDVEAVFFDRWRMDVLENELNRFNVELPLIPFGQGFKDMSPAIDELEATLLNSRARFGGNPVMTMCAANAVTTSDAAGNRKLDKKRARGRIDGMVAATMTYGTTQAVIEQNVTGAAVII